MKMHGGIQKRVKRDHDKEISREQQVRVGSELYFDHRQHAAFSSNSAEEFNQKEYYKRMPLRRGARKITEAQLQTDVIAQDCIPKQISD